VITDVPGIRVGHWTDTAARTGCTVVLPPQGAVASGEIRGGAPAEREFALLAPHRAVARVDAVLLTGGSAFGLAAADGAMRWCEEHDLGVETPAGRVPIVVAMALFDLLVAAKGVRPGPDAAYAACLAAAGAPPETGPVGAGIGARVGSWRGPEHARPGGVGSASATQGDVVVGALVAANAFGELRDGGAPVAAPEADPIAPFGRTNTTIGVIATNARLDKVGCHLVAQSGHDGLARAIEPAHTQFDGDGLVALATGAVEAPHIETVRALAARAVEAAIRQALA
jgi:L-aminopeptidase/D-esterase-like protein